MFHRVVVLFFAALVSLTYYPVFLGRIPIPTDQIIQFPAFQNYQTPETLNNRHGEMGDAVTQWYPWRKLAGESIRQGTLPLWNPHLLAGTPFQADPMAALFYPLNWLFIVFPATAAWSLSFMLKIFLSAVFTALFLREAGASLFGSIVSGLAFAFGGFMTTWIAWTHTDVSLWLPLVCFFTLRLCQTPSLGAAVVLAIAVAMTLVAGHPGVAAYVMLTAGGYGLWIVFWKRESRNGPPILWLAAAFAFAVGFAAVQVLPSIEWLGEIDRTLDLTWPPLPLWTALALFSRDLSADVNSAGLPIPLAVTYAGAMPLLLAVFAVFHRNRRDAVFFGAVLILSFCSAYGLGPMDELVDQTPVFKGLKKEEALILFEFSLAVLAGLGMSLIEGFRWSEWKVRKRLWLFTAVILPTAAFHYGTALLSKRTAGAVDWPGSPRAFRVLLVMSAVLILLRLLKLLSSRQWAVLAAGLLALDLLSFSHAYFPFNPTSLIFPKAGLYDFLKDQPKPFRTVSLDSSSPVNIGPNYGLSAADGYDFMLKRLIRVTQGLTLPRRDAIGFSAGGVLSTNNRILDLLNVKYLVATRFNQSLELMRTQPERFRESWSDGNVTVFENLRVLPRAFLVPQRKIEVVSTEAEEVARLCNAKFDPMNAVILPAGFKGNGDGAASNSGAGLQAVTKYEESANWVRIKANASAPSVLVLNQIHYPGWNAYVDGKKAPVLRADYAFTGVLVDAGNHVIEFRFLPASFVLGAAISIASILFAVVACYRQRRLPG